MKNFWKEKESDVLIYGKKMNVIKSCVDRHLSDDKIAFVFQSSRGRVKKISYKELDKEISRFANLLKSFGVKKDSRVGIFLPKVPEMYFAFLGAVKCGCVAVPLFEAFKEDALYLRLERGDVDVLVTNKDLVKRYKNIKKPLKKMKNVFVVDSRKFKKDLEKQGADFDTRLVGLKDTMAMIFTSSTAGTPVAGIELPHYGIVQQHFTGEYSLDLKKEDNYFCTAHPGWVTGSIYGILAPLSIGATIFVLDGRFDDKTFIKFLKKNKISVLYTAPTALRLLKKRIKKSDLKNLRVLASVGEALTKATFNFYKKLGVEIIDTYWQTETGGIVISGAKSLPSAAGRLGKAVPGIKADILKGEIVLEKGWPAMMTGIYKHEKMFKSYFKGKWFLTHDLARKDKKGFFYFNSRKDDIIKTSGERVSPIEVESVLLKHPRVREVAVIGKPDKIRGSIIKAFVVLSSGNGNEKLKKELSEFVKKNYAGHAYPKEIEFVKSLPKTNSGKIIRMKLREE